MKKTVSVILVLAYCFTGCSTLRQNRQDRELATQANEMIAELSKSQYKDFEYLILALVDTIYEEVELRYEAELKHVAHLIEQDEEYTKEEALAEYIKATEKVSEQLQEVKGYYERQSADWISHYGDKSYKIESLLIRLNKVNARYLSQTEFFNLLNEGYEVAGMSIELYNKSREAN